MIKFWSIIGLAVYFAILLFVVLRDKKNSNVSDYFFASRSLPFWALSITFIASWWGAGSALSTADLAFSDGFSAFWYYGVPVLCSTFFMILGSSAIRKVQYLTQGEMMTARYNRQAGWLLALQVLIFMIFSAASQMVGIGMFLGGYLGINYEYAVILGTLITLIYSMFGGFRAVVLTDIIQFILLLISAIIVFAFAMFHAGGFSGIVEHAKIKELPNFTSFTSGAAKYYMYAITFGCSWMIQANVWQRISATKDAIDAKKMTIMSFFVYIPLYLIVVFTGMASIVLFPTLPKSGVVIEIVNNYVPSFFSVFVFIGISAAIMSTMDSLINTGAMTLVLDLLPKQSDEKKQIALSRLATLFTTIIAIIISLKIRSILDISWIASDVLTTGVFVPLIFGFFWRRGNKYGALSSMIVGILFCSYNLIIFWGYKLPSFWEVQSINQVLLGVGISLFCYILGSLITPAEYQKSDKFIKRTGLFK